VAHDEHPRFLTVTEAAAILRIGRTAAYAQARRWKETGGIEGLPVVSAGGQLRVPWTLFAKQYMLASEPSDAPGSVREQKPRSPEPHPVDGEVTPGPSKRRRSQRRPGQAGLPFAS
jgi:hypothetical protein